MLEKYRRETGDDTSTVIVSTASPFKFCAAVLEALNETPEGAGPELIGQLETVTGVRAPEPLKALAGKTARFTDSFDKAELPDVVRRFLK